MIKNSSKPSDGYSKPPSGRPMTLRQQLEELEVVVIMGDDKPYRVKVKLPDNQVDALEIICQEIAREARLDELTWARDMAENDVAGFSLISLNYVNQRIAELTQKPPQPPQGGLEEVSDGSS